MKKCAIVFAMAIILLVPVTPTMADITDQPKTEAGRCFIVDYGNDLFYIYSKSFYIGRMLNVDHNFFVLPSWFSTSSRAFTAMKGFYVPKHSKYVECFSF